jgi:hypothetical protein
MSNHDYCQCENSSSVYSETNDWGYWNVCSDCNKAIEDSYTYFTEDQSDDL